jgi:hypothetical protein
MRTTPHGPAVCLSEAAGLCSDREGLLFRSAIGKTGAHALKDPDLVAKLSRFIAAGKPVLLTDGLASRLAGKVRLDAPNVQVLRVAGSPKSLLGLSGDELDKLRAPLLRGLGATFRGPNEAGLYLFDDGNWVVENFNDEAAHFSRWYQ